MGAVWAEASAVHGSDDIMAFERGVEQRISIITYDGQTPTQPTTPAVTLSLDGAAYVPATNALTHISDGSSTLILTAAETNCDALIVRVTSDNLEPHNYTFYFEGSYTSTRAELIDIINQKIDALPEGAAFNYPNDTDYGYELVGGTHISGTVEDTSTVGMPLVFAPAVDALLDVNFKFQLGASRVDEVIFRGYFSGSGPAAQIYADVYAYDFDGNEWVLITDAGNRIPRSTANVSLTWILAPQFQNELGEVRLRYVSSRMDVNDRLYIDIHLVEGVMIGATISEIAEGIWVHNIRNRALDGTHRSAGYFLSRTAPNWAAVVEVDGTVVTMDTSNQYWQDDDDLFNGRLIQFHKSGGHEYEVRRIVSHSSGGVISLDRAPVIVDGSDWHGYVLPEVLVSDESLQGSLVTITVKDSEDYPVQYARAQIRRSGIVVTTGTTSDIGQLVLGLDDGEYQLTLSSIVGYVFDNPYDFTVSGDTDVDIIVESFMEEPSPSPEYCRVYVEAIENPGGNYPEGQFRVSAVHYPRFLSQISIVKADTSQSNLNNGIAYLDCLIGSVVTLELVTGNDMISKRNVLIPNKESVNWSEL